MSWLWLLFACASEGQVPDLSRRIGATTLFERRAASKEHKANYELASSYSQAHGGLGMVVLEGDTVVFESYPKGVDPTRSLPLYSGTKTFSCLAAMMAVSEGKLSLSSKAGLSGDERAHRITIEQLLHFTSGLHVDKASRLDGVLEKGRIEDHFRRGATRPTTFAPGERFQYSPSHLHAFGRVFSSKVGKEPYEYLKQTIFEPLDFQAAGWTTDHAGHHLLAYGAWTTATEWAKIGVLLRDDGQFLGKQVVPSGFLSQCFEGSEPNPAYGLAIWLNKASSAEIPGPGTLDRPLDKHPIFYRNGPKDLVVAAGFHDQRLYISKSEDLVVVRFGTGEAGFRDPEFLARLLHGVASNKQVTARAPRRCSTLPGAGWWWAVGLLYAVRRRASSTKP